MKRSADNFKTINNQRVVLVLQDNTAFWFRAKDGKVVDRFVECVTDDLNLRKKPPLWVEGDVNNKSRYIDLVLDTTLDEVDRVSVSTANNRVIDRYRRLTTLARLRQDYPHASVYALPKPYQDQVAAIMHPAYLACWGPWLLALQSDGLVFHQVCTGTELLARWARRFDSRVFVSMQAGNYQRHLLVDEGAAVYLRTISVSESGVGSSGNTLENTAIEQSMAYLESVIDLNAQDTSMVGFTRNLGLSTDDVLTSPCFVDKVGAELSSEQTVVGGQQDDLVAMLLDNPVSYERGLWKDGQIKAIRREHSERIFKTTPLSKAFAGAVRLIRGKDNRFESHRSMRDGWPVLLSVLQKMDALAPSVQHQKSSRYIARWLKTTFLLVVMAAAILSVTVVNALSSVRMLQSQGAQIEELNAAARKLNVSPPGGGSIATVKSADSLFLADQLSSLQSIRPKQILNNVATAVTAVPSIALDHMVWAVVDRNDTYQTLFYALASVGHRQSLEQVDETTILQLELSGRVEGGSLFERKEQLDDLVAQLRLIPGTLDVQIMQSPADAALSSDAEARALNVFRVSLKNEQ